MAEKIVFITGATGLIGKFYTEQFLKKNFTVVFTSSKNEKIKEFEELYSHYKDQLFGIYVDLMSESAIETIKVFLTQKKLQPNYLVNNARNISHLALEGDGFPNKNNWLNEYYLDVVLPCQLSQAILEISAANLEAIVNISSMYGMIAPHLSLYDNPKQESPIHYGICKAAVIQLTKELAVRLASANVRVNAISYGGVEGRAKDSFKERYGKLCPMERMLTQEDVFGPLYFLCSDQSSGMTGHNLVVDGGFSIW